LYLENRLCYESNGGNFIKFHVKLRLVEFLLEGSVWACGLKIEPTNAIVAHFKKFRFTSKRAYPMSLRNRQVFHSYFSYKHYSHFNDHCALQVPWWFEKSFECCEILEEHFQLSPFSLSTKRSLFQNILSTICSFKVYCLAFPLTQIKLQTQKSTKLYSRIV